jgi:hypothetical protein
MVNGLWDDMGILDGKCLCTIGWHWHPVSAGLCISNLHVEIRQKASVGQSTGETPAPPKSAAVSQNGRNEGSAVYIHEIIEVYIALLKVADAAVDELGGPAGGRFVKVALLQ